MSNLELPDIYRRVDELEARVAVIERRLGELVIDTTFVEINVSAAGNTTLVAAVAGSQIRVIWMWITYSADADCKLTSGAGGTPQSGQAHLPIRGGGIWNYNPSGWFTTDAGEALVLNKAAAGGNVGGALGWAPV